MDANFSRPDAAFALYHQAGLSRVVYFDGSRGDGLLSVGSLGHQHSAITFDHHHHYPTSAKQAMSCQQFPTLSDRIRGSLFGLAVTDALGGPVEFHKRGTFQPVVGYRYNGTFDLPPG
jgi:hypothetical protein